MYKSQNIKLQAGHRSTEASVSETAGAEIGRSFEPRDLKPAGQNIKTLCQNK